MAEHRLADPKLAVTSLNGWLVAVASKLIDSIVMVFTPLGSESCDEAYEHGRTATGFAIDRDVVVSAAHVEPESRVCLADAYGNRFEGRVWGVDRRWDTIFIRSGRPLNPASIALERPPIGSIAVLCGMPYGILRPFLSIGIVSGYNVNTTIDGRYVEGLMILSALAMPGMSGGPVVNVDEEVVGVLVANAMNSNEFALAVPSKRIYYGYNILRKLGKIVHARLGLKVAEGIARRIGSGTGVVVTSVFNRDIEEVCGIKVGSVVVSVDDTAIRSLEDLWDALDRAVMAGRSAITIRFYNGLEEKARECIYPVSLG